VNAGFKGVQFGGYAGFKKAKFGWNADFEGAKFCEDANFKAAHFKYAGFKEAQFGGLASFDGTQFGENANFEEAQFGGFAGFERAQFGGYVNFRRAAFTGGNASFGGAVFTGVGVNFRQTEFTGGYVGFSGAQFGGNTNFGGAVFTGGNAYFGGAQFGGNADFKGADFQGGYADFARAGFTGGDANFGGVKFGGNANFMGTMFNNELRLDNLRFERLYITWDSIKDKLVYDGPIYLALIKNFKAIEQFGDADDCYYIYRRKSQARKKLFSKKRFNWSKLLDWIGFVSCGYGVRIQPIILWVLGSVLGFTLLYKLLPSSYGGIAESGPSTVTMEAVNNSTLLLTLGSGDGVISPSWGECLYFSFTALTGGTPDGLHPVGLVKYAVMVESVLGYLFLALFVVVLARKIIR